MNVADVLLWYLLVSAPLTADRPSIHYWDQIHYSNDLDGYYILPATTRDDCEHIRRGDVELLCVPERNGRIVLPTSEVTAAARRKGGR